MFQGTSVVERNGVDQIDDFFVANDACIGGRANVLENGCVVFLPMQINPACDLRKFIKANLQRSVIKNSARCVICESSLRYRNGVNVLECSAEKLHSLLLQWASNWANQIYVAPSR